ncbi:hypothetical protein A11A3_11933 [Alcanivorax hongdengensis A-11-3]|uniref:Tol-pal system protein YbgF n=1 Tax=Alcanivorax hongdengensis A-11-3 TaxID=1177179 RepID=L0W9W5_9GAMM|nr:hypothetical protein [Alcanivorax hongdengensis]EKF73789.1 hypothetical protein A11A3_11933 [Alcanivorax hongdengensis A-11-3]
MRLVLLTCLLALSSWLSAQQPAAGEPQSDQALVDAEQRDARLREQQELKDRAEDLQQQVKTSQQLLKQQDAYLKALEQQLQALKAQQRDNNSPAQ